MAADKRNERGAFLPEYALVFAVFAVGIVGVAQAIHDRTGELVGDSWVGELALLDNLVIDETDRKQLRAAKIDTHRGDDDALLLDRRQRISRARTSPAAHRRQAGHGELRVA